MSYVWVGMGWGVRGLEVAVAVTGCMYVDFGQITLVLLVCHSESHL